MAGLRIMALGPFQFQALGFGFTGRQKAQRTPWATVPVLGGMDRVQWTGGESRTETISGAIFSEFGGMTALEGIKLAARIGRPLPLVDLSAGLLNVFGMNVVEDVTEDLGPFDTTGAPLKVAYSIKLRRYEGMDLGLGGALGRIVSLFA